MTLKIALSATKELPFDFKAEVQKHIAALVAHQSTVGVPAPTAHSLVERAVKRVQHGPESGKPDSFEADYEIEDDTPTLDARKLALARQAAAAADAAICVFSPPLRRRLVNMELATACAVKPEARTDAHKAAIARSDETNVKATKVHWTLARAEAEIHDLTEETIGAWKMPDFSA